MFKGLGGNLGGLFTKKTSAERRPQEIEQPAPFKVLTISDLPKLGATTAAPAQPAAVPQKTTRQLVLSDGPRRSIPEDSYIVPQTLDGRKSYAASIISSSTLKQSRSDHTWNQQRDDEIPPMPSRSDNLQTNPFMSNEDADDQNSPYDGGRSPYDNASVFNYYTGGAATPNPNAPHRGPSNRSQVPTGVPERLRPGMIDLEGWSPSTSVSSNPFGNSPQDERYTGKYSRDVSPVSDAGPVNQDIRYSDCGVNPFQGLNGNAREEREGSGPARDIWDMIVGPAKPEANMPPPSPRIRIDTSALDPQPIANSSRGGQPQHLNPPGSASPSPISPLEWYRDILVHYQGRPSEINRAMSYVPTPTSPHPPGLSPPEITTMAVPYLVDIETELAELRRTQVNPQAEMLAQKERDMVRELIQRQLAHEQAIAALERATGGKRMTRQQLEATNIWSEIDLSGAKRRTTINRNGGGGGPQAGGNALDDRQSIQSTVTVWPGSNDGFVPPVPRIPDQLLVKSSQEPKESKPQKPSLGLFRWGSKVKREPKQPALREAKGAPVTTLTATLASPDIVNSTPYNPDEPAITHRDSANYNQNYTPSSDSSHETTLNEKEPPRHHVRSESTNTVSAPPPYTRGTASDSSNSRRNSRQYQGVPRPMARVQRFPVKVSDLPRLSTGPSEHPHTFGRAATFPDMQFTPTTPHRARSSQIYEERRAELKAPINLGDIGFRSNLPSDRRDRAEKQRRRQEKRERLFKRGGALWLCGLCCGVRKMTRRMKIFWWSVFLILIVVSVAAGTITAVKKSQQQPEAVPTEGPTLVTMGGLPPMPVGNVTVTPRLTNSVNTCIAPSTMWSCKLPPPLAAGLNSAQPIFSWRVFALNNSAEIVNPNPALPLLDEYRNFSKIDGVLGPLAEGEATNFYVSLLQSNTTNPPSKRKRSHARQFRRQATQPETGEITAAAELQKIPRATVLPNQYSSQQLRFFDRGLASEHFKFIIHFQKTIYLRTITPDTSSDGTNKLDADGGVDPSEARFVCTWPATRFITKIYTRPNATDSLGRRKFIVDPNTIGAIGGINAGGFAGYPVEIQEDIANYAIDRIGAISCNAIDERGNIDPTNVLRKPVQPGIGTGQVGVDFKGCQCSWSNFKESTGQGI
ncbi:hypothetical protein DRE_03703 [Drechslerella stenobrocha 248]|uniref:Uncharacterized protein n=1 Tax=Drechslerella stenobrocha 248 TaxID=1043628 RepID=W7HS77_9PEZI|nr:hypothetical protein DRE_03703 [Drechslerella stenobrocha 248]